MRRIVVGISGATGSLLSLRILEALSEQDDVETHVVLSRWGRATAHVEIEESVSRLLELADHVHHTNDLAASISSGSFPVEAMVIVPCSMKTVAGIRHGYSDNLLLRAADVTIKESRRLVISPRESPLSAIHLENLLALARLGVRIVPPMPAFYQTPTSVSEIIDQLSMRVLDQLGIHSDIAPRWTGIEKANSRSVPAENGQSL